MNKVSLPTILVDSVIHVGCTDITPREQPGSSGSQEGQMLSVSQCPAAWTEIARLGGGEWSDISRDGAPLKFLDFNKMTEEVIDLLSERGIANGLAEKRLMWRAWATDEDGEDQYSLFDTQDQAMRETEEGCQPPTEDVRLVATEKLAMLWCNKPAMSPFFTMSALAAECFAHSDLDGIWWHDELAPNHCSAPRAGIFQHRLPELQMQVVPSYLSVEEDYEIDESIERTETTITFGGTAPISRLAGSGSPIAQTPTQNINICNS